VGFEERLRPFRAVGGLGSSRYSLHRTGPPDEGLVQTTAAAKHNLLHAEELAGLPGGLLKVEQVAARDNVGNALAAQEVLVGVAGSSGEDFDQMGLVSK
jgi:hypothetical protein